MEKKPNNLWIWGAILLIAVTMLVGMGGKGAAAEPMRRERTPDIEVEPGLQNRLMSGEDDVGYLIYFRERPDLSPAYEMGWEERGRYVVKALQASAENAQHGVGAYLDAKGVTYQSYWVDNMIVVQRGSNAATFNGLMGFPEIEALRSRRQPRLHEPVQESVSAADIQNVESNLIQIGVDEVWAMGYTGEGIVVANIDTGVRYTHEAMVNQYRGNLGGSFDHNYNWWDPSPGGTNLTPNDHDSHGSHTMGIILGDDGTDDQIGVAPGATWIACQGFEKPSDQELLECGQFMLAPWDLNGENSDPDLRPHIINNSWGDSAPCPYNLDPWYKGVISSWHAAGIYPVFSNGNASNCGISGLPWLGTVGNPARYGNVTGVGSTTSTGVYATHSLWGPTDDPDTINPMGYSNLKPQVVAPGVSIRSAVMSGDTAYGFKTGTSMSAPHVTGLIALMWEAAPCLIGDYATTETLLQQTARGVPYNTGSGAVVPNYATGWGEIDAVAAVQAALEACPIYTTPRSQSVCRPGEGIFVVEANQSVTDTVNLSLSGLPYGVTSTFSTNPISSTVTSTLETSVTIMASAGDYPLEIQGLSGSETYTDTVVLEIRLGVPDQPNLVSPLDEVVGVSERPELIWDSVPQADSYTLEVALSPGFSSVVYTATVSGTTHGVESWLNYDTEHYWRVIPDNVCGSGGESETFEFKTRPSPPILLVDDDDNNPDVLETYTTVLDNLGYGYAVWDTQPMGLEPDAGFLSHFAAVVWFTGGNFMAYTGPGADGEAALGTWLDTGKCLLISSQDYEFANSGVTSFMTDYLGVTSVTDYVQHENVTGAGPVFGDLGLFNLVYPADIENYSDSMTPDIGTDTAFMGDGSVAGVSLDSGTFQTTFWGFPFEALPTQEDRENAMLDFLGWCLDERIYLPIIIR